MFYIVLYILLLISNIFIYISCSEHFRIFWIWQPILRSHNPHPWLGIVAQELSDQGQDCPFLSPSWRLAVNHFPFSMMNQRKMRGSSPTKTYLLCQDTTTATKPECMVCQNKYGRIVIKSQKQVLCLCNTYWSWMFSEDFGAGPNLFGCKVHV